MFWKNLFKCWKCEHTITIFGDECKYCWLFDHHRSHPQYHQEMEYVWCFGKKDHGLQWFKEARDKILDLLNSEYSQTEKIRKKVKKLLNM